MKKQLLILAGLIFNLYISHANAQLFWNQACLFNAGINPDYIAVIHKAPLDITGSFTLEAWINPVNVNSPASQVIFKKRAGINTDGYELSLTSGKVTISTNFNVRLIGTEVIPNNQWTHIAGTYNAVSNTFNIYINGTPDTSAVVASAAPVSNTDSLLIGKGGVAGSFSGQMDEVRVWNRALSLAEVRKFRRTSLGTSSGIYNALVLSLTFQDDNSSGTYFSLADQSGNSNNGINRGVTAVDLSNRPSTTISLNESVELDGSYDYLSGPDNSSVSPDSAITMEAWVYPRDPIINGYIIHKGPTSGGAGTNYRLRFSAGVLNATINGTTFNAPFNIQSDQWTHIAFTYRAGNGNWKFYINGIDTLQGTQSLGNINNGTDSLRIGGSGAVSVLDYFDGFIDEVRISNYVKSQGRINKFLYRSIDSGNEPDSNNTNVVYNFDGSTTDNSDVGPRLYFKGESQFSHAGTTNNQPVSPLNRADSMNFQNSFYLKASLKPIDLNGWIYDTLEMFYDQIISDVNLYVAVNHTDESNLEISLISPGGDEVNVFDQTSLVSSSDNLISIFNDQADSALSDSKYVSFGPSLKPASNMNSVFAGDRVGGKWVLKIRNLSGAESGRLYSWGLQINNETSIVASLKLSVLLQGLFIPGSLFDNGNNGLTPPTRIADTVLICIRSEEFPYIIIDCDVGIYNGEPDTNNHEPPEALFAFPGVPFDDENSFFVSVEHRNSIETWTQPFTIDLLSGAAIYNMVEDSSSAYGSNLVRVMSNPNWYAIYTGDVNQDGIVDATDNLLIDNDASNFTTGYVNTDLNGDEFVDASDALLADNNAANFVSVIIP